MMKSRIYKEASFDASHRLPHYQGKCAQLHGHRWRVEVWVEGEIDMTTKILVDYNLIRSVVERFDHQVILDKDDPMTACLLQFQPVITTPGDPTSELLAQLIGEQIRDECVKNGSNARVAKVRVWEAPNCYAEYQPEGK